jgi:hypothetical protein
MVALCASIAIVVISGDNGSDTWATVSGLLVCLIGLALPDRTRHARFRLEVADDERPPSADTTRRFVLIALSLAAVGAVWVALASLLVDDVLGAPGWAVELAIWAGVPLVGAVGF